MGVMAIPYYISSCLVPISLVCNGPLLSFSYNVASSLVSTLHDRVHSVVAYMFGAAVASVLFVLSVYFLLIVCGTPNFFQDGDWRAVDNFDMETTIFIKLQVALAWIVAVIVLVYFTY